MEKLSYLFTKYPSTPEGQKGINNMLKEVHERLNEKDQADQQYMCFWESLGKKVAEAEQILIADPLNQEKS